MEHTESNHKTMTSEEFFEAYTNASPKVQSIIRQVLELTEVDIIGTDTQGGGEKVWSNPD